MTNLAERRARFRALHQSGCFVIPNPWDVGSACILARLGFKALATTSAGAAWSMGLPDGGVTLDQMLDHISTLAAATDLPLSADFMHGYADDPAGVAANVARAVATGVAGQEAFEAGGEQHAGARGVDGFAGGADAGGGEAVVVERIGRIAGGVLDRQAGHARGDGAGDIGGDATGDPANPLYDDAAAAARVAAARQAIDASGSGVLLTARFEGFLAGRPDLDLAVARIKAYAQAGADVLFVPALPDMAAVTAVVRAAAPLPVNVIMSGPGFTVPELAGAGVRRVSIGGALARTAYAALIRAAVTIQDQGRLQPHVPVDPFTNLNAAFAN